MKALQNELRNVQGIGKMIFDEEESEDVPELLKNDINTFLWTALPKNTTFLDAEDPACALYNLIEKLYAGQTLKQIAEEK